MSAAALCMWTAFLRNPRKRADTGLPVFHAAGARGDLSAAYDPSSKAVAAQGQRLVRHPEQLQFTVAENTPVEEEIALTPNYWAKCLKTCWPVIILKPDHRPQTNRLLLHAARDCELHGG